MDARIISNQKPGFSIVSWFELYERGEFRMSKASRVWTYLRKIYVFFNIMSISCRIRNLSFLNENQVHYSLKSLRESDKFHAEKIRRLL